MHFKQNQIILNNMTLPKLKKNGFRTYTYTFDNTKATSDQKKVWSKEIMVTMVVVRSKNVVVCLPRSFCADTKRTL